MIDVLKSFFISEDSGETVIEGERQLQVSLVALLVEAAHADHDYSDSEKKQIEEIVAKHFNLEPEGVQSLMTAAEKLRAESTDIYSSAKQVKSKYEVHEREKVMEMLWEVVLNDGVIDRYEEHLCRQLSELLGLHHEQYLAAKLKALEKK